MMMEPIQMDFNPNQMDDEKTTIQLRKKYWEENVKNDAKECQIEITQRQTSSEDEQIPEIKDIYDHIYGNVQSKRVFYEGQQSREEKSSTNVKTTPVIENSKEDKANHDETTKPKSVPTSDSLIVSSVVKDNFEEPLINGNMVEHFQADLLASPTSLNGFIYEDTNDKTLTPDSYKNLVEAIQKDIKSDEALELDDSPAITPTNSPGFDKKNFEEPNTEKNSAKTCHKCQKTDFINDRSEVLTEINANLKLELESVKQQLKNEMAKNNELNFEIANIEVALETYYKEANNHKSTLSSIYSAMKNYVSDRNTEETYTYNRIKMIADYMESLKNKLEHQDKVIKNNFIENPYYTDLMIKHEAVLRQLDDMGKVNEELKEDMERKVAEEMDIIKELNRQKFQLVNKHKEMEDYYRNEIITKEALIRSVEDEYRKQLEDFQTVLDQKDEGMEKMHQTATARINNYKQELVIVYRKWKEQKMLNSSNK